MCRVLILIQNYNSLGGTEIAARNLSEALNEKGLICTILSIEEYKGLDNTIISLSKIFHSPRKNSSISRLLGISTREKILTQQLLQYCRKNNIETIINFTYENLYILPYNSNIKTIGVYHWSLKGYEESLFKLASNKGFIKRNVSHIFLKLYYNKLHKYIEKTDKSVVLTISGKNELEKISQNSNPIVIPNFLSYNSAKYIDLSNKGSRKAVFVGRLSKEKGVFHLLNIWEKIEREISDARLYIYGEGHERDQMISIINQRKIKGIIFKGFESDKTKIYSDADILLCPSETEGFGMVLIEGMNFGVVPFAFDCPVSPKELIGDCGMCAECFDCIQFASMVIETWKNKDKMQELAKKAFYRSLNFTKKNVTEKWIQLITESNI